jgi:hypothetical protein
MATHISDSADNSIGVVFTPPKWARFCVTRFGIVQKWLSGYSVCDPTAGNGAFIFALCDEALARGRTISDGLVKNLFVCEREGRFVSAFRQCFVNKYGVQFPERNVYVTDLVLNPPQLQVDFLVGNPPWANFSDLPSPYKDQIKSSFIEANLVPDPQALLLGGARIDLAALILVTAIAKLLRNDGKAAFVLPLSLFQNQGAHSGFRRYLLPGRVHYALRELLDFNGHRIFPGISTRFGVALFHKNRTTEYPIPYYVLDHGHWNEYRATPYPNATSPLAVHEAHEAPRDFRAENLIELRADQKPRQGVNTCGANEAFIFCEKPAFIPHDLVYPLIDKECFCLPDQDRHPRRFIFLPYDIHTGKPLQESLLKARFPHAWDYLETVRTKLERRKGTLIASWTNRGYWWALLGVGPYCFGPYKVVWQAYGARKFTPTVFGLYDGKPWQGNQAMHAYVPCYSKGEAEKLVLSLSHPSVQEFLEASRTEGTCNWAQPGRMKQIMKFGREYEPDLTPSTYPLFS